MRQRATRLAGVSAGGAVPSALSRALSAIRRNNGSAWWVPDSLTNSGIYTDSTGTTPVSTVGDVLGLVTDRAGRQFESSVPDFGVTSGFDNTLSSVTPDSFTTTAATTAMRVYINFQTVIGKTYRIHGTLNAFASGVVVPYARSAPNGAGTLLATGAPIAPSTPFSLEFVATTTQSCWVFAHGSPVSFSVSSIRQFEGNHATQATTANKPVIARIPRKLGPELVVNGDFSNGADRWSFAGAPNNWAISGGKLNGVGSGTFTYVDNTTSQPLEVGKSYVVTVDQVFAGSAATVFIRGASVNIPTSTGTHRFTITAGVGTTATLRFGSSGFTGTLDNVSVREVLEWSNVMDFDGSNDLLTLSSGAILQQGSDHWVSAGFVLDAGGAEQCIYASSNTGNTTNRVAYISTDASNNVRCIWQDNAGTVNTITGSVVSIGAPVVVTASRVGSTLSFWVNGVLAGTTAATVGATTTNTANVGALVRTTTQFMLNGKAIVTLGQSTLTEADRKTIERYLASQIGATYVG